MTNDRRWGGARARAGATDTTMLIWKVIDANPGITRAEIFAKVEDQIPLGYAKRRYDAHYRSRGRGADREASSVGPRARLYVLTESLTTMRRTGTIRRESDQYTVLRPIGRYQGDPAKVDETGTAAAEHLNTAYAMRTLRSLRARPHKSKAPRLSASEYAAVLALLEWAERRMRDEQ